MYGYTFSCGMLSWTYALDFKSLINLILYTFSSWSSSSSVVFLSDVLFFYNFRLFSSLYTTIPPPPPDHVRCLVLWVSFTFIRIKIHSSVCLNVLFFPTYHLLHIFDLTNMDVSLKAGNLTLIQPIAPFHSNVSTNSFNPLDSITDESILLSFSLFHATYDDDGTIYVQFYVGWITR